LGAENHKGANWVTLDTSEPIWRRFFTVAPLVLIGTREGEDYNFAPKHMVTPLGQDNYFGFVCTPRHRTYHNVREHKAFTVSFPRPDQVVLASLAATARHDECELPKAVLEGLPTFTAERIDGRLLTDAYLALECTLDRIVDGFGDYSLIAGRIVHARVHPDTLRSSERDEQEWLYENPLLAFLAYGRFAEIRETRAFPYPREFKE
jgi:flavin reductase (DIM6/NTAB) family NADH-FMN oxidoreductase RutF